MLNIIKTKFYKSNPNINQFQCQKDDECNEKYPTFRERAGNCSKGTSRLSI